MVFIHEVDHTASEAQQRVNIRAIKEKGDYTREVLERLDPATGNRILSHYPGGGLAMVGPGLDQDLLRRAVDLAIEQLGPPRAGRPAQSDSLATRQFALSLAHLYSVHASRPPGRRVDWKTGKELGPFREFVETLYGLLPFEFQFYKNSRPRGIDGLVKMAVAEYRDARMRYHETGNPTHLWNIDERLYLG